MALLIGDFSGALELLAVLKNMSDEDISSALEYKDKDGNSLMHRAVMNADASDLGEEERSTVSRSRSIRFEDEGLVSIAIWHVQTFVHFTRACAPVVLPLTSKGCLT